MDWLEALVQGAQAQLGSRELEELWSRGVSDLQIEQYRFGYLDQYLPEANYPNEFIEWWGSQDRSDVYVFPLTTTQGQVRGIQIRHVERSDKGYTDYIADREEPVLFGLGQAMPSIWSSETICLVEGVFDLCPVQRHIPYTVATLTAGVPGNLWRVLRRLVKRILLVYDDDATGLDKSFQIAREYGKSFKVDILKYPPRKMFKRPSQKLDPSEIWEAWGDSRFGVFLRNRFNLNQEI